MNLLLKEIRHTPLLWMLVFVPAVLVAEKTAPSAHTVLFVLAVLAIVPLAALLSHATESVAVAPDAFPVEVMRWRGTGRRLLFRKAFHIKGQ
jgi:fumarate reductase subunit C